MSVTTAAGRPVRDPGRMLWVATGAGWAILVALEFVPRGHLAHAAHAVTSMEAGTVAWPLVLAAFGAGWLVMVSAMMLPTTVPMARMFTVVSVRHAASGPVRTAFFGAYLAVWLAFAAVAIGAVVAAQPFLAGVAPAFVLAGALGLAGVFQFSPLKQRCLTACREPAAFLYAHYRRGVRGAWVVGLRHGLSCLGCCWALMLVMFATGVADLAWMLGLTAVMVTEKVARWGHRVVVPVGIVLLLAAAVLAAVGLEPAAAQMPDPHGSMHMH